MREWVIYVGIMAVILVVAFRDRGLVGALAGLLVSGPLYLAFGFVLAKFGYHRKSLKEMRTPRAEPSQKSSDTSESDGPAPRKRPPVTSRTSTGINRPKAKRRR